MSVRAYDVAATLARLDAGALDLDGALAALRSVDDGVEVRVVPAPWLPRPHRAAPRAAHRAPLTVPSGPVVPVAVLDLDDLDPDAVVADVLDRRRV